MKSQKSQSKTDQPLTEKAKAPKPDLKSLQSQIDDLTNKWKRAMADYQNLEKRLEKEKSDFAKFYNASLIDKLLSVLDDLQRTEKHLKNDGLKLTIKKFKDVLETEGVEEIKSDGEEFDPEKMDCVELTKGSKNIVIETILKGYLLNGRVLRPAKVKVGKGGK